MEKTNIVGNEVVALWRDWVKKNLIEALEKTPDDKLSFAPADNMMRLGEIYLHIVETSDWWYNEVMNGHEATELAVGNIPPREEIAAHLTEHFGRMEKLFAVSDDILKKTFSIERGGKRREFTGVWILVHMFEHDVHHRCQINQYLRILGIEPPQI